VFKLDGDGIYFKNNTENVITGQFLPGFPVWLAISFGLLGLKAFLIITPIIGILGLIALYLLGTELYNRTAGLIASSLLAINTLYLWFTRQPLSEIMANFILIGGIYFALLYIKERIELYSIISAASFGVLFLVRMDSILLLIPLSMLLIYFRTEEELKKAKLLFAVITGSFFILSIITLLVHYTNYFHLLSLYFLDLDLGSYQDRLAAEIFRINHLIKLLIVVAATALYIYVYKRAPAISRKFALWKTKAKYLKIALTGILTSIIVFQFYIRPSLPFKFMSPQANSARRLAWYFLPLDWIGLSDKPMYNNEYRFLIDIFILIFSISLIYTFYKIKNFRHLFVFTIFIVYAVVYFRNLFTVPYHYWLNRRFIVIILPFILLALGNMLSKMLRSGRLLQIASMTIVCFLVISFIGGFSLIARHHELDGSIRQIDYIAENLDDDSLYIMDASRGLQYHLIALPLKYIYGKNIVLFEPGDENNRRLGKLIPKLKEHFSNIYYCSGERDSLPSLPYSLRQRSWAELLVRRFETTTNIDHRPPYKVMDMRISLQVFHLTSESRITEMSSMLDFGSGREDFLGGGFYNAEISDSGSLRWTMDQFSFYAAPSKNRGSIRISMSNGRPHNLKPPRVSFSIGNEKLNEFYVLQEKREYIINLPEKYLQDKPILIKGTSDIWMPREAGVNLDVRELGVIIYNATLTNGGENE
jgi:hypothetical protein